MKTAVQFTIAKDMINRSLNLSWNGGGPLRVKLVSQNLSFQFRPLSRNEGQWNMRTVKSLTEDRDLRIRRWSSIYTKPEKTINVSLRNLEFEYDNDVSHIHKPNAENSRVTACVKDMVSMIKSNVRDNARINDICFVLMGTNLNMDVKHASQLIYCMSKLNIHNEALLLKLSKIIRNTISDVYKPHPIISGITKSFANLHLRDTETLDAIINWHRSEENPSSVADTITMLAILNYYPKHAEFLHKIAYSCDLLDLTSTMSYLNLAWSLTLLNQIKPSMIKLVLSEEFRLQVDSTISPVLRYSVYSKIFNIYAYSKIYKIDINQENSGFQPKKSSWVLNRSKQMRRANILVKSLLDTLCHLLPVSTYSLMVETDAGILIDALCFFDKQCNPITEKQFLKEDNGIRLAIIILDYKDFCLPKKNILTGLAEFRKQYLEKSGYKVLFLEYTQISTGDPLRKRTEFLLNKIKTVLPKFPLKNENKTK
ncbi:UNVERIFIED_CONTAM: hypothetical protein PYX00_008480 [Menopon gallinae]|uniref:RAP domain-containing protein n=1 Tax=Menopon gallinae TaxID=328185 RepID=A0AAW2HNE4_9NEOP